jgi:hypothetical protein
MQLEYAKNPRWVNPERTLIDLVIKWDQFPDELPFTANPNDTEEYGRLIFRAVLEGQFGEIAEYTPPPEMGIKASNAG